MKTAKKLLALFLISLSTAFAIAQESKNTSVVQSTPATSNALERQFVEMKGKSNSYNDYKIIKETKLNNFWKNVQDSISNVNKRLIEANNKIAAQKNELVSLKTDIEKREQQLQKSEFDISHISVLGIDFKKGSYIAFNFALILLLIGVLAVAIIKYRSSNKIALAKKSEHEDLNREFTEFKQRAKEKEIKLGRDLQTERNNVEELNRMISSLKKQVHM